MAVALRMLGWSAALAVTCGCIAPQPGPKTLARATGDPRLATVANQSAAQPPRHPAIGQVPATSPHYTPPQVAAVNRLMAELQTMGALDQDAQAQLLHDLQQTDPSLWPQLVQTFRASIAYRQRMSTTPESFDISGSPAIQTVAATTPSTNSAPPQPATLAATTTPNAAPTATASQQPPVAPPARYATPPAAAPAKPSEVQLTSATTKSAQPADWKATLETAIAELEKDTGSERKPAEETARQAHLRMLYLAAGRRDDALKPISTATAAEQDFWTQQLYGLSTWLDTKGAADPSRRAAEAAAHLNRAMSRLREASPLLVRNLAFCTEVSSYGVYQPFDKHEFKPSQQVILYAEVENFQSDESSKGFHTALRCSYQILDSQGRRVAEQDLKLTEEHCHNPRRDYFVRYFITLPARLYDGKHTLQLTIEDTLGQKIGQSSIDFVAREK